MDHGWKPYAFTDVDFNTMAVVLNKIMVIEPENERRGWKCGRCGSKITTAALGKIPSRVGFPREITGWETFGQAMKRCGINPDCDFETAAIVTRSLYWLLMEQQI